MLINCPKCGFGSEVPEDKLPKVPSRVKCKKCGATYILEKPQRSSLVSIEKLPDNKIKVLCPFCGLNYSVDPAKLPVGKVRTKCASCGKYFFFIAKQENKGFFVPPPPPSTLPEAFLSPPKKEEEYDEPNEQSKPQFPFSKDEELPIVSSETSENEMVIKPKEQKKPEPKFFIIDADGNRDGPMTIFELRERTQSGNIDKETKIELPSGETKFAGQMIELETAFMGTSAIEKQIEEETPEIRKPDLAKGIGSGAIAGIGCGVLGAIETSLAGIGIIGAFIKIAGGEVPIFINLLILGLVYYLAFGMVFGLLISIVDSAKIIRDETHSIWNSHIPPFIGAIIGLVLGIIAIASGGSIVFLINGPIEGYLLTAVIMYINKSLTKEE